MNPSSKSSGYTKDYSQNNYSKPSKPKQRGYPSYGNRYNSKSSYQQNQASPKVTPMPVKSNMIRESTVQLESISSDTNTKKDNAATQTQVEPSYPAWTGNHLSSKLKGEDENKGMFLSVEVICLDQPEPASSSTTAYSLSRIHPLGSRASSSASTSLSPRMKEIHAKSDLSHSPLTHGLPSFLSESSEDKVKPNFSPKARAVDPPVERERKLNTSDSSLLFSSSVSEKPAPEVESTPISSSQNVVLEPKVPVVHHNWDSLSSSSDSNEYGAHPINAEEVVEPKVEPPAPTTPKTSTRNKEMTIPQRTVCVSRVPAKTFNSSMPFLDKKISLEQSHNVPTISGVPNASTKYTNINHQQDQEESYKRVQQERQLAHEEDLLNQEHYNKVMAEVSQPTLVIKKDQGRVEEKEGGKMKVVVHETNDFSQFAFFKGSSASTYTHYSRNSKKSNNSFFSDKYPQKKNKNSLSRSQSTPSHIMDPALKQFDASNKRTIERSIGGQKNEDGVPPAKLILKDFKNDEKRPSYSTGRNGNKKDKVPDPAEDASKEVSTEHYNELKSKPRRGSSRRNSINQAPSEPQDHATTEPSKEKKTVINVDVIVPLNLKQADNKEIKKENSRKKGQNKKEMNEERKGTREHPKKQFSSKNGPVIEKERRSSINSHSSHRGSMDSTNAYNTRHNSISKSGSGSLNRSSKAKGSQLENWREGLPDSSTRQKEESNKKEVPEPEKDKKVEENGNYMKKKNMKRRDSRKESFAAEEGAPNSFGKDRTKRVPYEKRKNNKPFEGKNRRESVSEVKNKEVTVESAAKEKASLVEQENREETVVPPVETKEEEKIETPVETKEEEKIITPEETKEEEKIETPVETKEEEKVVPPVEEPTAEEKKANTVEEPVKETKQEPDATIVPPSVSSPVEESNVSTTNEQTFMSNDSTISFPSTTSGASSQVNNVDTASVMSNVSMSSGPLGSPSIVSRGMGESPIITNGLYRMASNGMIISASQLNGSYQPVPQQVPIQYINPYYSYYTISPSQAQFIQQEPMSGSRSSQTNLYGSYTYGVPMTASYPMMPQTSMMGSGSPEMHVNDYYYGSYPNYPQNYQHYGSSYNNNNGYKRNYYENTKRQNRNGHYNNRNGSYRDGNKYENYQQSIYGERKSTMKMNEPQVKEVEVTSTIHDDSADVDLSENHDVPQENNEQSN